MSNSLGTLTGALIAQEGLPLLLAQYPVIKDIATDFSNLPVKYGQTVTTRIPSVGIVTDYDLTNGYVAQNATSTDVSVTINKHKHASFVLTDQDLSGTNRNLVAEYSNSFSQQIGEQIMSDLSALWIAATYTHGTVQATSGANIANVYGAANTALNTRNAIRDRFAVLSSPLAGSIRTDPTYVYLTAGGVGISGAEIPIIQGVKTTEYSALPTTGNLTGVIGAKDSIVFASRVPEDVTQYGINLPGTITVVTDDKTGLSIQVREFYDMTKGKLQITFTLMYGVAVGNANSLQLITSA